MSTKLYIMIKGRTKGPFAIEKLRQLAEQGQLSKMHQVSDDQMSWVAAGDYEGGLLWQQWEEPEPEPEPEPEGPPPESGWFYTRNGTQLGPIGLSELKNLFGCGELKGEEQVWTEGMEHWRAAEEVPEFKSFLQAEPIIEEPQRIVNEGSIEEENAPEQTRPLKSTNRSGRRGSSTSIELTQETCKIANGSRGWTIFISVVIYLSAAVLLIAAIINAVQGIKTEQTALFMMAIVWFISAAIYVAGGLLLLNYSNKMALFRHKKKESYLRDALSALNKLWLFISVVLIVSIVASAIATLIFIVEVNKRM